MACTMSSFPQDSTDSNHLPLQDDLVDNIFPTFFPDLSHSPLLEPSSTMQTATASLPFEAYPHMGFLSHGHSSLGMAEPLSNQQSSSFWHNSTLEIPNPFTQQIWLPLPSPASQLSSSTATPTYELHPGMASRYDQGRTERSYSFASINS